jgi:hypothetical protein
MMFTMEQYDLDYRIGAAKEEAVVMVFQGGIGPLCLMEVS